MKLQIKQKMLIGMKHDDEGPEGEEHLLSLVCPFIYPCKQQHNMYVKSIVNK